MTFTTRAGQKFTVEVLEDIGHGYVCKIIKGRKLFVGRTMVFAKNDIS